MRFKKHRANQMNFAAYGESWFKKKRLRSNEKYNTILKSKKPNLN